MANPLDNLTHKLTVEEARKGGNNSVEARRKKKAVRERLKEYLELTDKEGIPYSDKIIIGIIENAIDKDSGGNYNSFKTILEAIGELEPLEDKVLPTININVTDNSNLEKVMYEEK